MMQQQFELNGEQLVRLEKGAYEYFYKMVGEGFQMQLQLEAVQKGTDILLVQNNERLYAAGGENLFRNIGGVNFAEVCNGLLKRANILDIQLTNDEREGKLIQPTQERLMRSFINMSEDKAKEKMLTISFLENRNESILSLDMDDVFYVIQNSYAQPINALEKLVTMYGYENLEAFETKISKLLKFRNDYLEMMGYDAEEGLGLVGEVIKANVPGFGLVELKNNLRGNFGNVTMAKKVTIGRGSVEYYLNTIDIAKDATF